MATYQEILDERECSVCGPESLSDKLEIGILENILEALGVTMTQAQIMAQANCYVCLGLSLAESIKMVLLDTVASNVSGGSGSGVGAVMRGSGPPVADPADPTAGAIYYDDDSTSPSYDTAWHWSVPDQLWIGA